MANPVMNNLVIIGVAALALTATGCDDCGCKAGTKEKQVEVGDILQMKVSKETVMVLDNGHANSTCVIGGRYGYTVRFKHGDIKCIHSFEADPITITEETPRVVSNIKEKKP